jgi:soluble P-type ATPase
VGGSRKTGFGLLYPLFPDSRGLQQRESVNDLPVRSWRVIKVAVPHRADLALEFLALDYNGTLALDGALLPGVAASLTRLSEKLSIRVITSDTFGSAEKGLAGLPVSLTVLPSPEVSAGKLTEVRKLGLEKTAAIGNGYNDHLMVQNCILGIAVSGPEGANAVTLAKADLVFTDINLALGALLNPLRLTAGLRD